MICDECNRSTSGRCWQHQQPIRWTDASERIWREQEAPQESDPIIPQQETAIHPDSSAVGEQLPVDSEMPESPLAATDAPGRLRESLTRKTRHEPDADGSEGEHCYDCGKAVGLVWTAPDAMWSAVTGRADGAGLLCVRCFDQRALAKGTFLRWVPQPLDAPLSAPPEPTFEVRDMPDGHKAVIVDPPEPLDVEALRTALEEAGFTLWDNDAGYVIEDADLAFIAAAYARAKEGKP